MQDVEASDRVISNDTKTTITATRMRSLRLKLYRRYTDVAPANIESIRKANLRSLDGEI